MRTLSSYKQHLFQGQAPASGPSAPLMLFYLPLTTLPAVSHYVLALPPVTYAQMDMHTHTLALADICWPASTMLLEILMCSQSLLRAYSWISFFLLAQAFHSWGRPGPISTDSLHSFPSVFWIFLASLCRP